MQFTHILFLMASVAIAGPLLAHLLNRSKFRRVPFTMLQFLHVSQKQTQSKRRLRDFLILLLRCAIMLLIAILFAGPVIYQQIHKETTKQFHFLVLDDSLSMSCKDGSETCFDQMIKEATGYLRKSKGPQSVFHLYSTTQGCIGKDLTAEAAALAIQETDICYGASDLTGLWADLKQTQNSKGRGDTVSVHVISDFTDDIVRSFRNQAGVADVDKFSFSVIPEDLKANNLAITDGSVIHLKDERLTLSATVANYGNQQSKRLIRAEIDGIHSNEVLINPAAGAQENVVLTLDISEVSDKKIFLPIDIALSPEDDLTADDVYPIAVALEADQKRKVLLLGYDDEELFLMSTALKTLEQSTNTSIQSIDTVQYSEFNPDRLFSYDMVIASTVARSFQSHAEPIQQYIEAGGRWVFFSDDRVHEKTAKILYQNQILPAIPQRNMATVTNLGRLENTSLQAESAEGRMLSVLEQYQLERVPLWSYYQCEQHPEAVCLWPIDSMASLVYQMPVKMGRCTFINTSIDDSRSALTKNAAILPLIQYLSGGDQQIEEFHFACDETVRVPISGNSLAGEVDYLDPADQKHTALTTGGLIQIAAPHECGWVRTLTEPVSYAGVHAIKGETILNRSFSGQVEKILADAFRTETSDTLSQAGGGLSKEARNLDKVLVWLIILLILTDCFIANRMQRS